MMIRSLVLAYYEETGDVSSNCVKYVTMLVSLHMQKKMFPLVWDLWGRRLSYTTCVQSAKVIISFFFPLLIYSTRFNNSTPGKQQLGSNKKILRSNPGIIYARVKFRDSTVQVFVPSSRDTRFFSIPPPTQASSRIGCVLKVFSRCSHCLLYTSPSPRD